MAIKDYKIKVSIITVCFNSQDYIRSAIDSVFSQTYSNIEYLVIDGGSRDNTLSIINQFGNKISVFLSEPDNGIYDAMNKGIKLATGDIIGILNSDDLYINNDIITRIVETFKQHECDSVYGDLYYVSRENTDNVIRNWSSNKFEQGSFRSGWHPPHPTFFVKKEIYQKYGLFNTDFKLSADFELMLRFLEKEKISTYYLQIPMIRMRLGGATSKSINNIIKQNIECYKAFKTNKLKVSLLYPLFRILPKILQFFKK